MSQEIFYTSAPAGLKPGSQGFSTVVSTSGMAKNLAEQLEGLSGYRHVFAPHDPNAAHNPVVNMHVKLTVGGRPFHVLSRICDAGIDYTQRTNKFAHHLALETAELSPAGPAAVLAAPGFMQAAWDGQPRLLAAGRTPPQLAATPAVCRAWQQVTGDAGWGGVLAETLGPAVGAPIKRQAVLIFRPGIDCLPLLAEALSLVPPAERWSVTFSTYFTKLPPGMECRWRCVLEGSPEAAQVQRSAAVLVLDLCRPMPAASGGPLVDGARTARVSWPKTAPAPRPLQPAAPPMPAVASASVDELEQALAEENSASLLPEPMAGVAGESSEAYGVRPPPRKRELPESPLAVKKASRPKWQWAAGGAAAVIMVIGIAVASYKFGEVRGIPIADSGLTTTNLTVDTQKKVPKAETPGDAEKKTESAKAAPKPTDTPRESLRDANKDGQPNPAALSPDPKKDPDPPRVAKDPPVPAPVQTIVTEFDLPTITAKDSKDSVVLGNKFDSPDIRIVGGESVDVGISIRLTKLSPSDWEVFLHNSASPEPALIASLRLLDRDLLFTWKAKPKMKEANLLRNCILEARTSTHVRRIKLRVSKKVGPLAISDQFSIATIAIPIDGLPSIFDNHHIESLSPDYGFEIEPREVRGLSINQIHGPQGSLPVPAIQVKPHGDEYDRARALEFRLALETCPDSHVKVRLSFVGLASPYLKPRPWPELRKVRKQHIHAHVIDLRKQVENQSKLAAEPASQEVQSERRKSLELLKSQLLDWDAYEVALGRIESAPESAKIQFKLFRLVDGERIYFLAGETPTVSTGKKTVIGPESSP